MELEKHYESCRLCPRECGADRRTGSGACGESGVMRVARAAPHFWEEPCISGRRGSGAVFFSGCALRCVFCQNGIISRSETGKEVAPERLCDIFLELRDKGTDNINLVTGTHFTPSIAESIRLARKKGLDLPIIWNSSGYEKPETLRLLDGLVDVYLPDLKYYSQRPAAEYSSAPDYRARAGEALVEMFRQVGGCVFDDSGLIRRGMIVRHMCLPGRVMDSKKVIEYLHSTFGDDIYISIMSQYTPQPGMTGPLRRRLRSKEYSEVVDYATSIGVVNGFTQEGAAAKESFIPQFDLEGV